jgi:tRNA threonylcarbamoyladenosine biosynthesis protein TsaE
MDKKLTNRVISFIAKSPEELPEIASKIKEVADGITIWLFEGEMGAGKTTLIKALANAFGVISSVSSPTFSIVNEYVNASNEVFYHFDFYRIKDEKEASDIGAEEYFDSGDICWIEWGAKIPHLLPADYLTIQIQPQPDQSRVISISKND